MANQGHTGLCQIVLTASLTQSTVVKNNDFSCMINPLSNYHLTSEFETGCQRQLVSAMTIVLKSCLFPTHVTTLVTEITITHLVQVLLTLEKAKGIT